MRISAAISLSANRKQRSPPKRSRWRTSPISAAGRSPTVKITGADKRAHGFEDEDTYDVINAIRRADGVKIAIFAREKDDGSYKISTRSSCDIDVAKICAIFGGGGHAGAAGCSVTPDEVDAAVARIIKECGFDD